MPIKTIYIISETPSRFVNITNRFISFHQVNLFDSHESPKIKLLKKATDIPTDAGVNSRCAIVFVGENGKPRPLEYVKLLNKKGGADVFLATMSVKLNESNDYIIDSVVFVNKTMFE